MTHVAPAVFMALLACSPLPHVSANPWRERSCGRDDRGCSSQKVHLVITRSHRAVKGVAKGFFWSNADSQQDTVTLPHSPPGYQLPVGLPGAEAAAQLHQAYTVISVYSHKLTTQVLCSHPLVARNARST